MVFKFVIGDKSGKCYQKEIEKSKATGLIGLGIGSEFDGGILGLPGYRLIITGGTDKDGFAMKKDVHGAVRKRLLLGKTFGKVKIEGLRRGKTVCGNKVSENIIQINTKVVKEGTKPLKTYFGGSEEIEGTVNKESTKEQPKEEKKKEESKQGKTKSETPKEEQKVEEKPTEVKDEKK